jgi:uncharacterized membrane protein YgdD (TMEM256/DUF423 family)
MIISTLFLFFIMHGKKMSRWEGMLLLFGYAFFAGTLFHVF